MKSHIATMYMLLSWANMVAGGSPEGRYADQRKALYRTHLIEYTQAKLYCAKVGNKKAANTAKSVWNIGGSAAVSATGALLGSQFASVTSALGEAVVPGVGYIGGVVLGKIYIQYFPIDLDLDCFHLKYPLDWQNAFHGLPEGTLTQGDLTWGQIYEINVPGYVVRLYKKRKCIITNRFEGRVCIKDTKNKRYLTSDELKEAPDHLQRVRIAIDNLFVKKGYTVSNDPGVDEFGYGFTIPKALTFDQGIARFFDNGNLFLNADLHSQRGRGIYEIMRKINDATYTIRLYKDKLGSVYLAIRKDSTGQPSAYIDLREYGMENPDDDIFRTALQELIGTETYYIYTEKYDLMSFGENFGTERFDDELP